MIEIVSCVCAIIAIAAALFATRKGLANIKKNTLEFFIPIFLCGCVLYFMGLTNNGEDESIILIILSSILDGIRMFAVSVDFGAISYLAYNNVFYAVSVTIVSVIAMMTTAVVFLDTFCKGVLNKFTLSNLKNKDKIVIVGASSYTKMFVDDLVKRNGKNIIVVTDKDDDDLKKYWYKRRIAVINEKVDAKTFASLGLFSARHKVTLVSLCENDEDNLKISLKLTDFLQVSLNDSVETLYTKRCKDNDTNISDIKEMLSNKIIESLKFSSFIMYKELDRIGHFKFAENFFGKIRFFNIYDIIARQFVFDNPLTKQLPPNLIDFKNAKVKENTKICSIFVGFGDINKQLLLKNICNNQLLGVDFNAVVFDCDIETPALQFKNFASGIFDQEPDSKSYLPLAKEKYNINFVENNILTKTFYSEIETIVKENDYTQIIVALGKEKTTVETALEIRQHLCESQLLNKASFFARIKDKESYFNSKKFNDKFKGSEINFFGSEQESITYSIIVDENLDKIAKKIAFNYGVDRYSKISEADSWNKLSLFEQESNRFAAYGIRLKLNLMGLDLTNDSKKAIDEIAYDKIYYLNEQEKNLRSKLTEDNYTEIFLRDENGEFVDTKRNNLAQLEHIRWNTLHFCYGWSRMPIEMLKCEQSASDSSKYKIVRKSERLKKHICLTSFKGLDKLTELSVTMLLKEGLSKSQALFEAESIRYDFDTMDNIFKTLDGADIFIKELEV